MAHNLRLVLLGEADPLQIAFNDSLAEKQCANIFNPMFNSNLRKLLDLVSHKNPTMRLLVVGAGTGGMTWPCPIRN
jgi:hypothetical protein